MSRRRVVVTGAGTINPLGLTVPDTIEAMREGRCAIGPLDIRDVDRLSIKIGAQVRGFAAEDHFSRQQIALYDRNVQFALLAAREAVAQSGITFNGRLTERSGVVIGTSGGGLGTQDDNYRAVYEEGKNRVHPFTVPRLMNNAACSHLSMEHGIRGPAFTVSSACASSNHAIGQALMLIRSGAADVALTGGTEAMLCFGGVKAWEGLRVLSPDGCRPFSADRNGMVQGEGSAIFVLEERDHAVGRGAEILAEVRGFGMTADASDIVMPSRDGAVRAMRAALSDADLAREAIGYVNAHGTGTAANDRIECSAISEVLDPDVPISSTKSMHGHLIGAAGAVEMLACLMALREGVLPPTVGYRAPDPDCPLDVVPNDAREVAVDAVLSNAFAFGGLNAVLALARA